MFDILVADSLAKEGLEILKAQPDVKLTVKEKWEPGELGKALGNYDGVIIRSGVKIKGPDLASPGKLKAIARAGVGVDNVDVEAATKAGVLVMNTPDANTITTAEHALTLMMAAIRKNSAGGCLASRGQMGSQVVHGNAACGQDAGDHRLRPHRQSRGEAGAGDGDEGRGI